MTSLDYAGRYRELLKEQSELAHEEDRIRTAFPGIVTEEELEKKKRTRLTPGSQPRRRESIFPSKAHRELFLKARQKLEEIEKRRIQVDAEVSIVRQRAVLEGIDLGHQPFGRIEQSIQHQLRSQEAEAGKSSVVAPTAPRLASHGPKIQKKISKEASIIVSYFKDGQKDIDQLARLLKNKAHIDYRQRSQKFRDPVSWRQRDPEGFNKHLYNQREKAKNKGWWDNIDRNHWRKYDN